MVKIKEVRNFALSFPETDERPHFHLRVFRVKKNIFATLDEKLERVMVKLTLVDQSVFCSYDKTIIYPVSGGWCKKGATYIDLKKVKRSIFKDALTNAFCNVAPDYLAKRFLPE